VPSKKLDPLFPPGAKKTDASFAFPFRAGYPGTPRTAFSLKQLSCPHCDQSQSLNRHSVLYGNDPFDCAKERVRGQRVFCSNRGQRGGCGRTFSVFLAEVLPRHTLTASLVWQCLLKLLAGLSLKAAAEKLRLPFALETVYRLRRSLRHGLDLLRTRLCREQTPPGSAHPDPLLQTVEHLQVVFPRSGCPPADFQLRFQRPFLG
jgi:hypothetical protein